MDEFNNSLFKEFKVNPKLSKRYLDCLLFLKQYKIEQSSKIVPLESTYVEEQVEEHVIRR